MENISVINSTQINNANIGEMSYNLGNIKEKKTGMGTTIGNLIASGGENLFSYLKSLNLLKESELIVLPSNHHYYYDENELKNIRTIVNLKQLNFIKDLDTFFHNLFSILPPNVNFIGCFSDSRTPNGNKFLSDVITRFNNFLDSKTDHQIDRNDVSELLQKWGFKVVNMTEIDGMTYFYSQNNFSNLKLTA